MLDVAAITAARLLQSRLATPSTIPSGLKFCSMMDIVEQL
jgi:hypothetical protein